MIVALFYITGVCVCVCVLALHLHSFNYIYFCLFLTIYNADKLKSLQNEIVTLNKMDLNFISTQTTKLILQPYKCLCTELFTYLETISGIQNKLQYTV